MIHLINAHRILKSCLDGAIKKRKTFKKRKREEGKKKHVCRTEKFFNCFSVN